MAESTRACPDCGTDITQRHHSAVRCEPCSARRAPWNIGKSRTMYDHACWHCGTAFRSRVKRQRFCSARCSGIATMIAPVERSCAACHAVFVGRSNTCSRRCYHWAKDHPGESIRTACGYCSEPIVGRARNAMYCSRNCAAMTVIGRRRANRNGKPVHRVRPHDIFERDEWMCHLCAEPIDRTQRGKTPGAPALDHLIPVSHPDYPGHTAANLAASHWVCNTSKGNRASPEDFALHARLLAELPPGKPMKRRPWMGPGPITHCIHGHEFTEENTYWRPDGDGRQCRRCFKRRAREKYRNEDPAVREARLRELRRLRPKSSCRSGAGNLVLF